MCRLSIHTEECRVLIIGEKFKTRRPTRQMKWRGRRKVKRDGGIQKAGARRRLEGGLQMAWKKRICPHPGGASTMDKETLAAVVIHL